MFPEIMGDRINVLQSDARNMGRQSDIGAHSCAHMLSTKNSALNNGLFFYEMFDEVSHERVV